MFRIIFEKLTVEEKEKVRGGTEESNLPSPDMCEVDDSMPPDRECKI